MLFQCKVCGPATDHGAAPKRSDSKSRPWRTIDIHCHCMVPEANAMVLKATGIPGGGETPNANAHVNALTKSIQPQRHRSGAWDDGWRVWHERHPCQGGGFGG